MIKKILTAFFLVAALSGCYSGREEGMSTTPVTNNPNIVPKYGNSPIPGMDSGSGIR